MEQDKNEKTSKVVFLGPRHYGKSSVLRNLAGQGGLAEKPTIGVEFAVFLADNDTNIQMWDVSGQELETGHWSGISRMYLRHSQLVIIIISAKTEPEVCKKYIKEKARLIEEVVDPKTPILLVCSKVDLLDQDQKNALETKLKELQEDFNLNGYYLVSALNGTGISELRGGIISTIQNQVKREPLPPKGEIIYENDPLPSNVQSVNDDKTSKDEKSEDNSKKCSLM